jgi:hypothetical protein
MEGRWSIDADNSTGILELSWSGGQFSGRVYFDSLRHWEPLANIRFDAVSGQIDFDRPEANQHYTGRLVNANALEGTFSGGRRWLAKRAIGDAGVARSMEGRWSIDADNSTGILELSWSGGQFSGRVYFDVLRHWEPLANIRFDAVGGQIDFDRPEANQHYTGRLVNASALEGTFSGGRRWLAKRVIDRAAEGRWSINADNSTGILELSWSGGQFSGRVYFDSLRHWEPLTNVRFEAVSGQIDFDRPEANQHYTGRLVNASALEGTFSGGRRWLAKRN